MSDLWVRDTEITLLVALSAFLIVLPIQLLLRFKAKTLLVKLIPTILLAAAVVAFYAIVFVIQDRAAIGYALLALFSEILLLFSGLAWGIWAITKLIRKRKRKSTV